MHSFEYLSAKFGPVQIYRTDNGKYILIIQILEGKELVQKSIKFIKDFTKSHDKSLEFSVNTVFVIIFARARYEELLQTCQISRMWTDPGIVKKIVLGLSTEWKESNKLYNKDYLEQTQDNIQYRELSIYV